MRNLEVVVNNEFEMKADMKKVLLFFISKIDTSNLVYPKIVILPFSEIEKQAGKMIVKWSGVGDFTNQLARTKLYFNTKAPLCSCLFFQKINTFYENDIGYCKVVFNDDVIKRYIE